MLHLLHSRPNQPPLGPLQTRICDTFLKQGTYTYNTNTNNVNNYKIRHNLSHDVHYNTNHCTNHCQQACKCYANALNTKYHIINILIEIPCHYLAFIQFSVVYPTLRFCIPSVLFGMFFAYARCKYKNVLSLFFSFSVCRR